MLFQVRPDGLLVKTKCKMWTWWRRTMGGVSGSIPDIVQKSFLQQGWTRYDYIPEKYSHPYFFASRLLP